VHVVPKRPAVACALVVTAQYGYEHGANMSLLPNELLLFESKTLLYHCVEQLVEAGMETIVVVVHAGVNGPGMVRAAREAVADAAIDLQFVHLPKSTCHGSSIIAARKHLPSQFLLVAADHVFSTALIRRMANGTGRREALLAELNS
jgi:choline kinase